MSRCDRSAEPRKSEAAKHIDVPILLDTRAKISSNHKSQITNRKSGYPGLPFGTANWTSGSWPALATTTESSRLFTY
jgi:hypothetical protein